MTFDIKAKMWGIEINNFHGYKGDKRTLINNCVSNELGLHILKSAFQEEQKVLFQERP